MSMHQYDQDTFLYTTETDIVVKCGDHSNALQFSMLFSGDKKLCINNI